MMEGAASTPLNPSAEGATSAHYAVLKPLCADEHPLHMLTEKIKIKKLLFLIFIRHARNLKSRHFGSSTGCTFCVEDLDSTHQAL